MKDLIDPKPTVVEVDPMDRHDPPKKDTTAYQKNLEKIMKEEEELEEKKEAIEAAKKDVPKNPVVEASEAAEEAHVEQVKSERIQKYEDAQKLLEDLAAKQAEFKKRQKANEAKISGSAELWTANMPEKYLDGYLQTEIDDVKQQFAQILNQEGDSDSDSDSSDSDDE